MRAPLEIDAESFVSVKGCKAKGKRVSTWQIEKIEELEPLRTPDPEPTDDPAASNSLTAEDDVDLDPDAGKTQQQIIDEMTGQLNLFADLDNSDDTTK